ncbi:MAG: restriction endonuclease subunit S, partial [Sphaerospermopsis kisseleviana]
GTHAPPPRVNDNGIPLLSVRNIVNDKFINLDDDSLISEEAFQELNRSFKVCENDILLAIVGTLGKVAVVEKMPTFTIQRSLAVLRTQEKKCLFKFLFYFIKSPDFQKLLWINTGFSAQPGIYLGSLANFFVLIPPIIEQKEIIKYLDTKTAEIEEQKTKIQQAIDLLKEYRTALITN